MRKFLAIFMLIACMSSYSSNKLFIFFINGVNVTADDADYNLMKLQGLIENNSPLITWNILYSPTRGLWKSDIWDFIRQKKQERKKASIDKYAVDYIVKNDLECCSTADEYWVVKAQLLGRFLQDRSYVGKNLEGIVEQFHKKIPAPADDIYILIIAHSQGNEYANQLWDYLVNGEGFKKDHISIIGIASPASRKMDYSYYFTADNDKIINSARVLPMKPLEANVHLEDCKEFTCHSLVESYLNDNVVAKKICNSIKTFVSLVVNDQSVC